MSDEFVMFTNEPMKGHPSQLSILKSSDKKNLYIREDVTDEEPTVLWLSNKTALEMATWIIDNVPNNSN